MTHAELLEKIAIALVVPVVTAVLSVLGVAFSDWRARRSQAGRRKLALEDASRQVSFAAEWWNARMLVADSPKASQEAAARAMAWLEEASALVTVSTPPPVAAAPAITLRRVFLLHPLRRRQARVLRVFYYLCLGWLLIWGGALVTDSLDPTKNADYRLGDVVMLSAGVVLALGLRFWAGSVERREPADGQRRRVTLGRALLIYRLHRPAAVAVQVLFHVYVLALAAFLVMLLHYEPTQLLPGDMIQFSTLVGLAVALRYWAASLDARAAPGGDPRRGGPVPAAGRTEVVEPR